MLPAQACTIQGGLPRSRRMQIMPMRYLSSSRRKPGASVRRTTIDALRALTISIRPDIQRHVLLTIDPAAASAAAVDMRRVVPPDVKARTVAHSSPLETLAMSSRPSISTSTGRTMPLRPATNRPPTALRTSRLLDIRTTRHHLRRTSHHLILALRATLTQPWEDHGPKWGDDRPAPAPRQGSLSDRRRKAGTAWLCEGF